MHYREIIFKSVSNVTSIITQNIEYNLKNKTDNIALNKTKVKNNKILYWRFYFLGKMNLKILHEQ